MQQQRESHTNYNEKRNEKTRNHKKLYAVIGGVSVAYALYRYSTSTLERNSRENAEPDRKFDHDTIRPDLPTFSLKEVNKHNSKYNTIV